MDKILFVCLVSPFEIVSGGHQRTNLIFNILIQYFKIDIVCFSSDVLPKVLPEGCSVKYWGEIKVKRTLMEKVINRLRYIWNPLLASNKAYANIVNDILLNNMYKHIFVRHIYAACAAGLIKNEALVLDVDDLLEEIIKSEFSNKHTKNALKWVCNFWLVYRTRKCTKTFLDRIKHSYLPNKKQCIYKNSSYLPNIPYPLKIEIENVQWEQKNDTVLFVGQFSHLPNLLGMDHFIDKIWPKILEEIPSAVLRIVGKKLPEKFYKKWAKSHHVEICGFVDCLVDMYAQCKVVVAPIYQGGGTNIKVLEAISMKSPCVLSEFALRGFEDYLYDSEHVFVAKTDEVFASKVCLLLKSEMWSRRLVDNSQRVVEKEFSLNIFRKCLLLKLL